MESRGGNEEMKIRKDITENMETELEQGEYIGRGISSILEIKLKRERKERER